jgi:hypothetical protein
MGIQKIPCLLIPKLTTQSAGQARRSMVQSPPLKCLFSLIAFKFPSDFSKPLGLRLIRSSAACFLIFRLLPYGLSVTSGAISEALPDDDNATITFAAQKDGSLRATYRSGPPIRDAVQLSRDLPL